jgi:hypothetical protein
MKKEKNWKAEQYLRHEEGLAGGRTDEDIPF